MRTRHTFPSRLHRTRINKNCSQNEKSTHVWGSWCVDFSFGEIKNRSPSENSIWRDSLQNINLLVLCCQRRLKNRHSKTTSSRMVGRILCNNTTLHGFSPTGRFATQVFVNCNVRSITALPVFAVNFLKWGRHPPLRTPLYALGCKDSGS